MVRALPLLAALFVLVSCSGSDSEDDAAEPAGGELAFTVNRNGWGEIWLMRPDGTERRRLTERKPVENDGAGNQSPAWSHDGERIAYAAQIGSRNEEQSKTEIYVMRADGTDVRRLTTNEHLDMQPSWSPDGERIAFTRIFEPGTAQSRSGIYLLNADGGDEEQLTHAVAPVFDFAPAWSPDGDKIAFAHASFGGKAEIHVVRLDERTPTNLGEGSEPQWSPDGARIAFTGFRDRNGRTCFHDCSQSGEIYVMDAEGGRQTRLTETEANDGSPAWSPDGTRIAFVSDRSDPQEHENEIYVMDPDGGDVRRITDNDVWDLEPAWRP